MTELVLQAFTMNCVGHQSPGLWTRPGDRSVAYHGLEHWQSLARLCERGLFDGIFLADVLGPYDVYGGSPAAALHAAAQVPVNDPLLLVPAMAAVTDHLGFGVTVSATYEHPYLLARRFSTLDHLTEGRIGWNIVTSYLDSAARASGRPRQMDHAARYAHADDVMTLLYKLWEGSWEEGAVREDRVAGIYADPARIHRVIHDGPAAEAFDAIHLCAPSPQRTPVLYQAGSSSDGRAFAARHAECVFVSGPNATVLRPRVAALRKAARDRGREIKVLALATAIVAATDTEARDLIASYREAVHVEGALALLSGWTGVDFSANAPSDAIGFVENRAGRTALENFTRADPSRVWTLGDVAAHVAIGGAGPVFVGSPSRVADALIGFAREVDVDGFNLSYAAMPRDLEAVVDLLVPALQDRGAFKTAYREGSLREKLLGGDRLLMPPHPGGIVRRDRAHRR